MPRYPHLNHLWCAVGCVEATGGTETSKYPEEEKSTEIPSVVVSESGRAQTRCVSSLQALRNGGCTAYGSWLQTTRRYRSPASSRTSLERTAIGGDSPVDERGPATV